ncbi:MAG: flagellar basal body-associated FliL family protein [Nitrospinae bacterium]|nr:flagellar basal body-associated FliL family protein [Nitrospinota bacterium]MBF0635009.1 flagellar basal body-associated FliL family protein [Nitrospinota bacterium]
MAKKRRTELDIDSDFLAEEQAEAPPKVEEAPSPPKPEAPKPPKKKINKVKLLIVVGAGTAATVLTVALVWLAIVFFSSITAARHVEPPPPPPKEEAQPGPTIAPTYALDPFLIPLKEKGAAENKLVKIEFTLEMTSPETQRDIERNITLVRENVYFMLQSKEGRDFIGKEMLEKIAVDVAIAVNRSLQSGGVTRAWITGVLIS